MRDALSRFCDHRSVKVAVGLAVLGLAANWAYRLSEHGGWLPIVWLSAFGLLFASYVIDFGLWLRSRLLVPETKITLTVPGALSEEDTLALVRAVRSELLRVHRQRGAAL